MHSQVYAIHFKQKRLSELRIRIFPHCRIHHIVPMLNTISYSPPLPKKEHVSYALLELINNSLRAHRERGVGDPVLLRLRAAPLKLHVEIADKGGGFDPQKLPFDIFSDTLPTDLNSEPFLQYRRVHQDKRFGMGLIIARRVFHRFSLEFIDREGKPCSWGSPSIMGTRITAVYENHA